jgi:hypothetical protein
MPKRLHLPSVLQDMFDQDQWVIWKFKNGKKIPFQGRKPKSFAKCNDPSTWCSYHEAIDAAASSRAHGIGFALPGSGIGALDLDDCREPETVVIDEWARRIIRQSKGAYVEVTPSQRGLRIIGKARGGRVHTQLRMSSGKCEIYRDAERHITVSGDQIGTCSKLPNIDHLIDHLVEKAKRCSRRFHHIQLTRTELNAATTDWRTVLRKYQAPGLRRYIVHEVAVGKRSSVIWKIGRTLAEKKATPDEVAAVIAASHAWQSKHGHNPRALTREVSRIFS